MIKIGGELAINVAKVHSDRWFVRPSGSPNYFNGYCNDLSIESNTGEMLHICGSNDWAYLALDLLKPLLKEADKLYHKISNDIDNIHPEVILVGRNDFRLLDVLHTARDTEKGIEVIKGIPIVKGDFLDGVKYLGHKENELPFE